MKDFDQILDDCLVQISNGVSTLDDCLARHPEHAARLRPILLTALRLGAGRTVVPSPALKARARARLTMYMQAHPRRKSTAFPVLRLAFDMAALLLAFLVTGTALAQGALPGDALYDWKLISEQVWSAVAPDPLALDLALSERRVNEMLAVSGDADAYAAALAGYQEVLARLTARTDADSQARILFVLTSQQEALKSAGISIPELDVYFDAVEEFAPTPMPLPLPTVIPTVIPTPVPTDITTIIPTIINPTLPIPPFP
jgi:hypothetical protein